MTTPPAASPATATSLEELTRLAADAPTTDELVRRLMGALQELSGLESIFVARVDHAHDRFQLTYTHNAATSRHPLPEGTEIPWSESVCRHALASGTAETHTARDRWPHLDVTDELHITTYAIEPIRDDAGVVIATLCAISDRRKPVTEPARQAMKGGARLVAPRLGGSAETTAAGAMETLAAPPVRDGMTGLPTRPALLAELARALGERGDAGTRVHLAMVDLVGLDVIDENSGHYASDQFVYAASQRLAGVVATMPGAFLARPGDRAFAVLVRLPATDPDRGGAGAVAEIGAQTLHERLAAVTRGQYDIAWSPVGYDGAVVTVVAAAPGEDAQALLWRAEEAMRAAAAATLAQSPSSAAGSF